MKNQRIKMSMNKMCPLERRFVQQVTEEVTKIAAQFGFKKEDVPGLLRRVCEANSIDENPEDENPGVKMQIYAMDKNGIIKIINVAETESVGSLKDKIQDKFGIPSFHQRLIHNGKHLDDNDKPIRDYGVYELSVIRIIQTLREW